MTDTLSELYRHAAETGEGGEQADGLAIRMINEIRSE